MIPRPFLCTVICVLLLFTPVLSAQDRKPADAVAEVPELTAFHEVIFQIWHKAWPDKNTAMLKDLLPEVEKGISSVVSAKLPGILREKKAAWEEGLKKMQAAGADYKAAVQAGDNTRLLSAAENLHSRFEALMRVTRPAMKELEDFHSTLYMLYHYYFPEYDLEKIRVSAGELKQKMQALAAASLPERLKPKEPAFQAARQGLSDSVDALNAVVGTGREEPIKKTIEELHTRYQAVQKIFE